MPRDFVPCLYHEREMFDEVSQTWHVRLEATELFAVCPLTTRVPEVILSRNSHAYSVGQTQTAHQHLAMPWHGRPSLVADERTRLFTTFYAAMAALE